MKSLCFGLILGWLAVMPGGQALAAAEIREPAWAGSFYPAEPAALAAAIDSLTSRAMVPAQGPPAGARLRALVMPHAGYLYSGWTAAHAGKVLERGVFRKVLLIGPDHRVGFTHGAISKAAYYRTPLGLVRLHPDAAALLRQEELFRSVPASDRAEHSLEVVLPFLQHYLGSFDLVPVVLGSTDPQVMATSLVPLVDQQTLLVVSSDLSHYLPYDQAVVQDRRTIEQILALDAAALAVGENRACGREPLLILLELARRNSWRPYLLQYTNSGDTAGDKERVVGYAALAFYEGKREITMEKSEQLEPALGQYLVRLARLTISERLRQPVASREFEIPGHAFDAAALQAKRGVFVTLHKQGQLRGCIGSLTGSKSIVEGVREHAVNAAFNDYRFRPVTREELGDLEIEVSILTEPRRLDYDGGEELLARLRPGVDGVIIRLGEASATFLPQVWEQLPKPEEFLGHLCQKAGLSPQEWRQGRLEVQTYQVQYFAEEK